MNIKGKIQRGITLIALIITIIVMLILVSVTISMAINGGLFEKAGEATNKWKKEQIKEKVSFAMVEYTMEKAITPNTDFVNFIRKNLEVGIVQNEDETYSFMLDGWQVVITKNEIISVEKYKLDTDRIYSSVAEMKADTELVVGKLVQTEGYWNKKYGGGANYDIVSSTSLTIDEGKCIQLDNGLYAVLHAINDTVTVNQFGAYGDGENDDAQAIQLALNSGYRNIIFENEQYKSDQTITLTTNNVTILGNNTVLFTDNEFADSEEWFFKIFQAENINMYSLNIEAKETIPVGYKTQLGVVKSTNVEIHKCNFLVPETAPSQQLDGGTKEYNNIDLFSGWHDIKIDNCDLKLLHDGEAGGCIWIRDIQKEGSDNLIFTNNNCTKISHDEILAIFYGSVENVTIENNNFKMEEKDASSSVMAISIGYGENSAKMDNIILRNNKMDFISSGGAIWATNTTNVLIENNDINYKRSNNSIIETFVIHDANSENFKVLKNRINVNGSEVTGVIKNTDDLIENIIEINCKVIHDVMNLTNQVSKNTIICNKEIRQLFRGCINVLENNVKINNHVSCIFAYQNDLSSDCKIKNNTIEYIYEDNDSTVIDSFFMIMGLGRGLIMNNYTLELEGNTLIAPNVNTNVNRFYTIAIEDVTPQTVLIKNNNIQGFRQRYLNNSIHNLILENNVLY